MEEKTVKLIIADDHRLFRIGILELISDLGFIEVIGEAENGQELVQKYFELKPDIILVDISMPLLSGIEAVKKISADDPNVKALFLSMYDGEEYIYGCLKVGARGLINKNINKEELVKAIKEISSGERYFKDYDENQLEKIYTRFEKKESNSSYNNLTKREKIILTLISEGFTSSEIAQRLNLSKRTIDTHRTHLIQKLNLRSLPDLIKYAIEFSQSNVPHL